MLKPFSFQRFASERRSPAPPSCEVSALKPGVESAVEADDQERGRLERQQEERFGIRENLGGRNSGSCSYGKEQEKQPETEDEPNLLFKNNLGFSRESLASRKLQAEKISESFKTTKRPSFDSGRSSLGARRNSNPNPSRQFNRGSLTSSTSRPLAAASNEPNEFSPEQSRRTQRKVHFESEKSRKPRPRNAFAVSSQGPASQAPSTSRSSFGTQQPRCTAPRALDPARPLGRGTTPTLEPNRDNQMAESSLVAVNSDKLTAMNPQAPTSYDTSIMLQDTAVMDLSNIFNEQQHKTSILEAELNELKMTLGSTREKLGAAEEKIKDLTVKNSEVQTSHLNSVSLLNEMNQKYEKAQHDLAERYERSKLDAQTIKEKTSIINQLKIKFAEELQSANNENAEVKKAYTDHFGLIPLMMPPTHKTSNMDVDPPIQVRVNTPTEMKDAATNTGVVVDPSPVQQQDANSEALKQEILELQNSNSVSQEWMQFMHNIIQKCVTCTEEFQRQQQA